MRSYQDPQYLSARRIVLEAAKIIAETHRKLLREYAHKRGTFAFLVLINSMDQARPASVYPSSLCPRRLFHQRSIQRGQASGDAA